MCLGQAVASADPRPHLPSYSQSRAGSMIYFANLCRKCKTIFYRGKWKIMMHICMSVAYLKYLTIWLNDWLTDWRADWLTACYPLANILLIFCNFARGKLRWNWIVSHIKWWFRMRFIAIAMCVCVGVCVCIGAIANGIQLFRYGLA